MCKEFDLQLFKDHLVELNLQYQTNTVQHKNSITAYWKENLPERVKFAITPYFKISEIEAYGGV